MNQERVILFCGHMCDEPFVYSKDDDYGKTMMSWFTMLSPEIRAGPSSSVILSSASSSSSLRKRKRNTPPTLSGHFYLHFSRRSQQNTGDWKLALLMKHPRKSPHIIVLDEVFDPDIGTWESLPNPLFMSPNPPFMNPLYQPREMDNDVRGFSRMLHPRGELPIAAVAGVLETPTSNVGLHLRILWFLKMQC
uniref:Uncharacterized protein n=1 Tax=Quercus lobata TaxID=97700 RepID=A0A7N2MZ12_QUELO